jgi:transcriptional regulator with XRE-family HTH domain
MMQARSQPPKASNFEDFGQRLRQLRKERKLSLKDLSARANVSVGMLSHIERSRTTPSLRTLDRICIALGVEMANLFPADVLPSSSDAKAHIVRAGSRARLDLSTTGLVKELLGPSSAKTLEFFLLTIEPGGGSGKEKLVRSGEKAGLVLSGQVRLSVGSDVFALGEGDSFLFDSGTPHQIVNDRDNEARVLWIIRPDQVGREI